MASSEPSEPESSAGGPAAEEQRQREQAPSLREPAKPPELIKCFYCGREVNAASYSCPFCGKSPSGPWRKVEEPYYEYEGISGDELLLKKKVSGTLIAGGVLAIIAGVLAFGQGILYGFVGSALAAYIPSGSLCLCGALDMVFGIASIGAGVFAIQGESFVLSIVGAILGMLGLGFILGGILGFIAVILIAVSREEFTE